MARLGQGVDGRAVRLWRATQRIAVLNAGM
jgi:hypothetical protein